MHPKPLPLIRDGTVLRRNLKSEMLTLGDLMEQLREQGIGEVKLVKRCFLEADGHLSVIKQEQGDEGPHRRKQSPGAG